MRISENGFIDYEINNNPNAYANSNVQISQGQELPLGLEPVEQQHNVQDQEMPMQDLNDGVQQGAVFPGQDTGFLKWLFDFRKEAIIPLRNVWRGREFNYITNKWEDSKNFKIMNETGISWGISLIESFMNPAFIVTDLDDITYSFRMQSSVRVIWNSLSLRYKEFDLLKSDIHRVAEEIESKVSAILRGAIDNGYRDFFSTQNQTIEHKQLGLQQAQQKPSAWTGLANMLGKREGQ